MAKKTAGTRAAKPAAQRPGARGAAAREGAPQGRPIDRSIAATRGERQPAGEKGETIEVVRVRVREDVRNGMVYYDNRRHRAGDVFDLLDPSHFNPEQHEKVHSRTKLRTTTSKQVLAAAHDDVLAKKFAASRQRTHTDDAPDDLPDTGGNPLDDE